MADLKLINAIGRAPLFVNTVIALGITGRLRAHHYNTSRVNIGLAASVIGLVFSVFIPLPMLLLDGYFNVLILFILDFISFALYVSASGAMTEQRHICHRPNRGHCGLYRAGIAFEFMSWIVLFFILLLEIYQFFSDSSGFQKSSYTYDRKRRPATSGVPTTEPITV